MNVARRVMWFEEPEQALSMPYRFLAYVMTYGTWEDVKAVRQVVTPEEFKEALENAPPGIVDPRSWAYWNLICGFEPALPMPKRDFSASAEMTDASVEMTDVSVESMSVSNE